MQRRRLSFLVAALTLTVAPLCALAPVPPVGPAKPTANAAARPVASIAPDRARVATARRKLPPRCSAGLVALTFDDGPSRTVTPRLVKTLVEHHVPATFFMVGSRIATAPHAAHLVQRAGFVIGNHTWSHADLTRLSDRAVRHQILQTRRELRHEHLEASDLMRPPYGAVNRRVRADIRGLGLVPVLWTIDSRDWAGGTPQQIASRILGALRPHQTNIVLQHDGVTNSPNSVAAVASVVHAARKRGFCFTHLGPRGGPARPSVGTSAPAKPRTVVARVATPVFLWSELIRLK